MRRGTVILQKFRCGWPHYMGFLLGKSALLQAIARRELPLPANMDIFLLSREMPGSSKTALQTVIDVDEERRLLEVESERLVIAKMTVRGF